MTPFRPTLSHPKYRPDIDGLRAIAVVLVVAFHAFPMWVRGGFIGVDIFFVISGFLISTIILESLEKGTFSFLEFYSRRIRRIFPALFLVLTATFAFGWFALLSEEYKQLGKHILAGAGFVSNLVLWQEAGYFDNSADTKPLLHLWSLGIEEQFYILWPLVIWLAWKKKFNIFTITIIFAAASFFLNIKGIRKDAVATFYSPQTRFWELSCGSLLAWLTVYKGEMLSRVGEKLDGWLRAAVYRKSDDCKRGLLNDLSSLFGFALLLWAAWRINREFSFPGKWATLPVLGAVLIIAAGPRAWINRTVLSNRLAVWIGIISFPLYLWHWPILSFARIVESGVPSRNMRIAAVMLALLLAWLTYIGVERRVRLGNHPRASVLVLMVLMGAIAFAGYDTYKRDGLAFRKNATLQGYKGEIGHLAYHKYVAEKYYRCTPEMLAREAPEWTGFVRCMQSRPGPDVDVALIGDSHAEHLFLGLADALPNRNVAFYIKGSPPFLGNADFSNIFKVVADSKTIKTVVLTMFWYGRYRE
ncbi:MAG: acyltransferase family protein, partial [Janthinobacterium lividum]